MVHQKISEFTNNLQGYFILLHVLPFSPLVLVLICILAHLPENWVKLSLKAQKKKL